MEPWTKTVTSQRLLHFRRFAGHRYHHRCGRRHREKEKEQI